MTMVLDPQSRQYGGTIGYENNMYPNMHAPAFTDPWQHQTSSHGQSRSGIPMHYQQLPPTSAPVTSSGHFASQAIQGTTSLNLSQDVPRSTVSYSEQQYSSPPTSGSSYSTAYPSISYAQSLHQQQAQQQRKGSEVSHDSRAANASFGELDASRGMLALSHSNLQDLTPRNIYDVRAQRGSSDSYGFPSTASGHSSVSAESGRSYPYYTGSSVSSVGDSATDYSSAASDSGYDPMSRTLPRPQGLMGSPLGPPAPQSMMGQFSSKMSGNTQKKHKCKVCDKRFTRPSSLQTHMYSHTGEKPFACDVEGCGRHFSVVSNLRRHKKVHKGEGASVSSVSDAEDNSSN